MEKIITTSERAIDASIRTGQYIRNGFNRLFMLEVKERTVVLKSLEDTKFVELSRKVFVQLYARKNYVQVSNPADFLKEAAIAQSVGSSRFMVK